MGDARHEGQPLLAGFGTKELTDPGQQRGQIKRGGLKVESSGFDLGEIQHVIDETEEMFGRIVNHGDAVLMGRGEMGVATENLGEAQNAVEGGAQLVTHTGEELTFRAIGGIGGVARFIEGESGFPPGGDVDRQTLEVVDRPRFIADHVDGFGHPKCGAVGPADFGLEIGDAVVVFDQLEEVVTPLRIDVDLSVDGVDIRDTRRGVCVAKHPSQGRVDLDEIAFDGRKVESLSRILEEGAVASLRDRQRFLGPESASPFRDIDRHSEDARLTLELDAIRVEQVESGLARAGVKLGFEIPDGDVVRNLLDKDFSLGEISPEIEIQGGATEDRFTRQGDAAEEGGIDLDERSAGQRGDGHECRAVVKGLGEEFLRFTKVGFAGRQLVAERLVFGRHGREDNVAQAVTRKTGQRNAALPGWG